LTRGSNDYINPNTNPTRSSRHLTWPGGDHRGGNYRGKLRGITGRKLPGWDHRGEITRGKSVCCFSMYVYMLPWILVYMHTTVHVCVQVLEHVTTKPLP